MITLASLRAYGRLLVVLRRFLPLAIAYLRDRRRFLLLGGRRRVTPATQRARAETLLETLLALGPTFIKLGQLLSTRPDVLPPVYIETLSELQDRVPPAEWAEAREVLEAELGPVEERFEAFDTDPISGASLGQVYLAEVDGDQVAVKVRRPGVEPLVEADLTVLRWLLPVVKRFVGEARAFSLENLADEFAETIREEMDYRREARMLEEIRGNFEADASIRIPATLESHSGDRVLTMEYVPGIKITDLEELDATGIDRTRVAETLERIYLQMIIDDGVFHADPHPGNLAVQEDGTIVFYDFGMSGRVDSFVQDRIVDFYLAVANQDIDAILDTLIELGTLSPEADRETMGRVMELAIADARGEDIEQYRVQQIVAQVEDTIYDFPFRLPRNLALVLRVATVVEGVCVTLDPDFDFIDVATDYLAEEGYREETARRILTGVREGAVDAARATARLPPKLESTLDSLDRGDLTVEARVRDPNDLLSRLGRQVGYGLMLGAATVGTAYLYRVMGPVAAAGGGVVSVGLAALLYRSFGQASTFRAPPEEFTRQAVEERRERFAMGQEGVGISEAIGIDPEAAIGEGEGPGEGADRTENT